MKKLLIIVSMTCMCLFADEFVESTTNIGGYGEMHYNMESNGGNGKLDFHRFILYFKLKKDNQYLQKLCT